MEPWCRGSGRGFSRGRSRGRGCKSWEILVCTRGRGRVAVAVLTQHRDPGYGSERTKQIIMRIRAVKGSGEASSNHASTPTSEPSKPSKRSQAI